MNSDDLLSNTRFAHWIRGLCARIRVCALGYAICALDMGFLHSDTRLISQDVSDCVMHSYFSYFEIGYMISESGIQLCNNALSYLMILTRYMYMVSQMSIRRSCAYFYLIISMGVVHYL
jgi:hypothetical protein